MYIILPVSHNPLLYVNDTGVKSEEIDKAIIDRAGDIKISTMLDTAAGVIDQLMWANVVIYRVTLMTEMEFSFVYYASFEKAVTGLSSVDEEDDVPSGDIVTEGLSFQRFNALWKEAKEYDGDDIESFANDNGGEVVGLSDPEPVRNTLLTIGTAATSKTPIDDLLTITDLSVAEFSRRYGMPDSTVRAWEKGTSAPNEWTLRLLTYAVVMDMVKA